MNRTAFALIFSLGALCLGMTVNNAAEARAPKVPKASVKWSKTLAYECNVRPTVSIQIDVRTGDTFRWNLAATCPLAKDKAGPPVWRKSTQYTCPGKLTWHIENVVPKGPGKVHTVLLRCHRK